jgi:hypothetical protein
MLDSEDKPAWFYFFTSIKSTTNYHTDLAIV